MGPSVVTRAPTISHHRVPSLATRSSNFFFSRAAHSPPHTSAQVFWNMVAIQRGWRNRRDMEMGEDTY
jgi:hypothetical protein